MLSGTPADASGQSGAAEHKRHVQWGIPDFVGHYHLNRMACTETPIPGTAIRIEKERNALIKQRAHSLKAARDDIEARRSRRAKSRTRQAAISARIGVQATVGYRMDAVERMYQRVAGEKRQRLRTAKYCADEAFHTFLGHVETNNIYQVKSRLRNKETAFPLVATAEEKHGNTPLHRSVSLGFLEMTRVLLEAGADVDEVNTMGDAAIHCCWRFWKGDTSKYFSWRKNPYLMTTRKHLEDFATMEKHVKTTVELLTVLLRSGADVDQQRNNGEVALHTAARRGPLQAVWALLLSKATHNVPDLRLLTPEAVAARAGNPDFVALLANWPIVRLKYYDSEFVQEWMKFVCDPDAHLDTDLTAGEVLGQVRIEEHEESTAVRARGGHLLVDEMITGPVLSAEERARAKVVAFTPDAVSLATTLESSVVASNSLPASNGSNDKVAGEEAVEGRHNESEKRGRKKGTKSKLGKEIDVFLAQARDENTVAPVDGALGGSTAYSRLVAKTQLEARRSRWPGPRDNGKDPPKGGQGSPADPFGRPMTTRQRRVLAAIEVAEDGGVEGPLLRAATSSVLLTTRSRAAGKTTAPHPFYGRRLLTQRVLNQLEREATIKPTATLGRMKAPGDAAEGKPCALYLNENRTAFHDTKLLPGPKDPGIAIDDGSGRKLHAQHPVSRRRKLHERPYSELQGHRKHNEDVYCSTLENYCAQDGRKLGTHEPLLPVRRRDVYLYK